MKKNYETKGWIVFKDSIVYCPERVYCFILPLYNPATKSNVNPQNEEVQNLIIFFEVMQNYNLNFAIKKFIHNFKCPL